MNNQKPRTIDEQIRLLRSRGMAFGNEEKAKQCLAHISYFRLKYYWTDMQDEETEHDFKRVLCLMMSLPDITLTAIYGAGKNQQKI